MRYADDTVLLAESEEELQKLVDAVKEGSLKFGLEMNTKKTKTMIIRRDVNDGSKVEIKVDGVLNIGASRIISIFGTTHNRRWEV